MKTHESISPRQLADALGVSESSVKRWCDQGSLQADRTVGGHRRIPVSAALKYLRESGRRVLQPEILGLPVMGRRGGSFTDYARRLERALLAGNAASVRRLILELHLAPRELALIGDEVIRPAFHAIGRGWAAGRVNIFEERRAVELILSALGDLRMKLPPPAEEPVACGGTLEGDQYAVATRLVELVLRDAGWQATNLGSSLPVEALLAADRALSPRLFWLSVTHVADPDRFKILCQLLARNCAARQAHFVLGGQGLQGLCVPQCPATVVLETLQDLKRFVGQILPVKPNGTRSAAAED